jgi:hypothetical protein
MAREAGVPATDEELLIREALRKRQATRSGRNLIITLAAAVICGVLGWAVLFQVRPFIKAIPLLPTGSVLATLLWIGIGAFALAGLLAVGGVAFASPRKPWGKEFPGACPKCLSLSLREDTVEFIKRDGARLNVGPRGLVILCETRGCDYASAKVTTASRA